MEDSPRMSPSANSVRTLVNPNTSDCHCPAPTGRKLIVAFDGTSNRFGRKNTNVVELYARIEKDNNQRTYYNSGIGTYAKPSWRFWSYWGTVIEHALDLILAYNFQSIVMGGYRWLSENYEEGDQIFLFGFSRGAYQVRVLAGMIERVGLIFPGNEEQIPFAYELYASSGANSLNDEDDLSPEKGKAQLTTGEWLIQEAWRSAIQVWTWIMQALVWVFMAFWIRVNPEMEEKRSETLSGDEMTVRFKETFSRSVKVHFVGVWDTVSSVGISRSKALPLAHSHGHICFFRHALALDECRVKFLPEYVYGGESLKNDTDEPLEHGVYTNVGVQKAENATPNTTPKKGKGDEKVETPKPPRLKEVWFAGSHSDVGGGIKDNKNLDVGDVPCLWMANEAMAAGLKLKPSKVEWDWKELQESKPTPSMTRFWSFLEWLPFKRLTYGSQTGTTRDIHLSRVRLIKPGQKIHASVAFKQRGKYKPKAMFSTEMKGNSWDAIIGKGHINDMDWVVDLEDILELDLFDHSQAGAMLAKLESTVDEGIAKTSLERLSHLALYDAGVRSIAKAEKHFQTLTDIFWENSPQLQLSSGVVLYRVASNRTGCTALHQALIDKVCAGVAVGSAGHEVRAMAVAILARMDKYPHYKVGMKKNEFMCGVQDRIRENNTVEWVVKCLEGENPDIRDFAAEGLIWLAKNDQKSRDAILGTGIINSLAAKLESKEVNAQCSGAKALSGIAKHDKMRAAILGTNTIFSLAEMLKNSNEEVKYAGLKALSKLSRHGEVRTEILKTDAVGSLAGMLKSQDSSVQVSGADALAELSKLGAMRAVILQTEIIRSLVDMIKSRDGDVQRAGTCALSEISKHDDMRHAILEMSAIGSLAEMLKIKNGSQKTSQSAASALRSLAKHDDIRPAILETDAVRSLASMLKSQDDFVKSTGAEVLVELSQHDDIRSAMLETEAIGSLARMFKSHHEGVQSSAAQALPTLAKYDNVRPAILGTDAIDSLARMLKSRDDNAQLLGAQALIALVQHDAIRAAILRTDAVGSLARTLRSQDKEVQSSSVNALAELVQHDDSRVAILGKDIISSFADILKSQEKDVQTSCVNVLNSLAKHDDIRAVILETDAVSSLARMLQTQDKDVRSLGVCVLAGLAQHDDIRAAITGTNAIISLAGMLKSQEKDVQSSGVRALAELAQYDDIRTVILGTDAIVSLVEMLESQDRVVQSLGANELTKVAQHDDIRAAILGTDAIISLSRTLKSQERDVQSSAARALAELTHHDDIRTAILGTDAIVSLAEILKSQEREVQSAARALTDLTQHDECRAAILQTDAIASLWAMLSSRDWYVRFSGALALSTLAEHGDTLPTIIEKFTRDALTPMLELLEHQDPAEHGRFVVLLRHFLKLGPVRGVIEKDDMDLIKARLEDYEETWEVEEESPLPFDTGISSSAAKF